MEEAIQIFLFSLRKHIVYMSTFPTLSHSHISQSQDMVIGVTRKNKINVDIWLNAFKGTARYVHVQESEENGP